MERRALEARALGRVVDGEIPPQVDLGIQAARLGQESVRPRPFELSLDDRRFGVVRDRGPLQVVDEEVELPAGLRIVQTVAVARPDLFEIGRIVEREPFDFFRRLKTEHIHGRYPERRHRRGGTKNQREQGGWDRSHQVFMDSKNSALLLVFRSLSNRKSIASMVPIGLRIRRRTYIFLSTAGSVSNSSLRVPERVMSMAGKVRLSATFLSRISSELPVPLNSSKMTSSMRLPVSTSAVATMVSEPPSSMLRAAPKNRFGRCNALESTPPESTLPEGGTTVLYARARRVMESSRITTSRLCSIRRFAFSITISATCTWRVAGSSKVELMTSPRTERCMSVTSSGRSSINSTISATSG